MKKIPLTQGKYTLVDEEDYNWLSQWKWYCSRDGYNEYARNGTFGVGMHRIIMDAPSGKEVDHIDGDGLNNQKSNLRIVTHQQNRWNYKKPRNNTSGYKGVHWHIQHKKWQAKIKVNVKRIYLGYFDDIKLAALAYNQAAQKYFGEFAN